MAFNVKNIDFMTSDSKIAFTGLSDSEISTLEAGEDVYPIKWTAVIKLASKEKLSEFADQLQSSYSVRLTLDNGDTYEMLTGSGSEMFTKIDINHQNSAVVIESALTKKAEDN
ncbi:hypothetical protein [Lentilactobacillus kosonis]|uniref:Uncharacterized protein n=1 Tax=Lentilactobacillus kosonis TaxID=2810561 RepID=A0A401FIT6_9LACO|nr:hypothetical protein [Lentilactobacillus kosonis]GAY72283.1 hypothetical protein NBRC111893_429 [Lentilactobacillus kosonis]